MIYDFVFALQNESENNPQENSHECANEDFAEELNFVPGTPLLFEDYTEKSVLVSANYGSTSVWIRLVGQNADVCYFNYFSI